MRTNAMIKFPAVFGFEKACDKEEIPLPSTFADWTNAIDVVEELVCAAAAFPKKTAKQVKIVAQNAKAYLLPIVPVSLCRLISGVIARNAPDLPIHKTNRMKKISTWPSPRI
ncbi:MAG TPA: hypothetical protein VG498_21975 [Terriglobales bacterium]|nr:hypothetical protein [Terriglobales bacterium]